ncbi:MAG: cell wall-binding repeat-containing protein [Chloroflexi bacterium]|nr:cell wall-binding repeat-containing protein [Chloroflexota bacterium]
MSRATSILLALLVLVATALPVAANEPDPPATAAAGEIIPGEVIVQFSEGTGAKVAGEHGLAVEVELGAPGEGGPALVSTEGRPVAQVVAELRADPSVEQVEPNYVVQLVNEGAVSAVGVNDPQTGGQYSLDRMRVRDAWSLSTGGSNVIAVLDTGVQYDHPDLAGRLLAGYDFVNDDTDASDDNGHGTWVSGIVAANANDGYGIAGVSWSDKILPVKIMNREGTGSTADLLAAITWSADQGADVINLSVGGFPYSQLMQDAVNDAFSKGAVLVGAAGNNRRQENFYPASFDNVISVSATQVDDEFSNWSSYGPKVDLSAPGSSVLTTNCYVCTYANHNTWGSHTYISGTSFATPNVVGVVALMRARYPGYTAQQVVDRLFSTVDDIGYPGMDNRYGRGRVNAYRALGASVTGPGPSTGDSLEPSNTLAAARGIGLGVTIRPSLHPAGDVDVFAVDLPSAGRLDVSVTGVVDTRAYPWNKSGLPIDPIVELYNTSGGLLQRIDDQSEAGTELASVTVSSPSRILVSISNWYANGSQSAYSLTPTFVDHVPPTLVSTQPGSGASNVSHDAVTVTADFSEDVSGLNGSSFQLIGPDGNPVGASVSYAWGRASLQPSSPLGAETTYTASLSSAITDAVGNPFAGATWTFTTGKAFFRLAGTDRYASAAAVSAFNFAPGVPVVYIATGSAFPDALAGGPAAKMGGGPLLLTTAGSLPVPTAAELGRLRPGRIVVLGGVGAVSNNVITQLNSYTSGGVTRLYGADRYATAAAISRATFPSGAGVVYLATGANYPDALAAGAAAARANAPILLTNTSSLPGATAAELRRLHPSQIIVMGGTGAVSDGVVGQLGAYAASVQRIAGADRYTTAVALSAATFAADSVSNVYVATGASYPDGLAAGPVAGANGAPLLLVGNSLPASVAAELRRLDPANVLIIGGTGVVSDTVRSQIRALWP